MGYEISRREVLNNLIRFRDSLLELHDKEMRDDRRTYKVLLNRNTGDMRFAKKISEFHIGNRSLKERDSHKDWQEVQITVGAGKNGFTRFILSDLQNHPLNPKLFDQTAWKIATETIDILNEKSKKEKEHTGKLIEESVLHDLSMIHLASPQEQIEAFAGWMGSISRLDAEKMLSQQMVGTYLLRDGDAILVSSAFHLSEENLLVIKPYIITVVEEEGKISDILLFKTEKGWTLYLDDPNLKDSQYHYAVSLHSLLKLLKNLVKYPL